MTATTDNRYDHGMSDTTPTTEQPTTVTPWYRQKPVWVVLGIALVLIVGGVIVGAVQPTNLQSAANKCDVDKSPYATVADGGNTLVLDGESEAGGDGLSVAKIGCVLSELSVTTAVTTQMDNTSSVQGRQVGSWDGVHATWTFHPDNGLDIILTRS